MKKVIEECPDDTYPIATEECLNDELDDENKNNFIEENDTKLNDEYGDNKKVNDEEGDEKTDTESLIRK